MKTITKKSAEKKLEKIISGYVNPVNGWVIGKISKTSIAYKRVIGVINGEKSIRPVHTSGSGRFTSNQDHTSSIMKLLNAIGIEFKFTNDAPKGGLTGNLITIITKIK